MRPTKDVGTSEYLFPLENWRFVIYIEIRSRPGVHYMTFHFGWCCNSNYHTFEFPLKFPLRITSLCNVIEIKTFSSETIRPGRDLNPREINPGIDESFIPSRGGR